MEELEARLIELEIKTAWQDEMIQSLNDTLARLNHQLDLQQAQLRLLYQRTQDKGQIEKPYSLADEIPPHY